MKIEFMIMKSETVCKLQNITSNLIFKNFIKNSIVLRNFVINYLC